MSDEGMEVRLRRQAGMSPEKKEAMAKFLNGQTDWYTHCAGCGKKIDGSSDEIIKHGEECNGKAS